MPITQEIMAITSFFALGEADAVTLWFYIFITEKGQKCTLIPKKQKIKSKLDRTIYIKGIHMVQKGDIIQKNRGEVMRPEQDLFIEKLFSACFQNMLKHAMRSIKEQSTAQDVVQDTFHTAVEKIDVLMTHEKPEAWLMTVLNNKIKQYFTKKKKDYEFLISIEEEGFSELGALDRRLEELYGGDERKKIEEVLTPEEFAFIKRLYIDHATHLELAKEYGFTVYGSKKKRERIMDKLYEAYPDFKRRNGKREK